MFLAAVTLAFVLAGIILLEYAGRDGNRGAAAITSQLAPVRAEAPVPAPGAAGGAAGMAATAALLDREVSTILERPLFSPSRRPGHAAVASTELPRLAGIIIGPHGARAIFATSGEDRAIIAGPGAHAGPDLVRAVDVAGVSVIGPNGPELLHPAYDRNAPRGTPAAASPVGASNPSILDLLRSRVQNGGGVNTRLPPSSLPQTAPGQQR